MDFINKIIDFCSSKLKYNKRFMVWDLKGHPLKFTDKRFYFLILLLILPTIIMAICIHILKDIYIAIVVFHFTITVGPVIYLFLNSKFVNDSEEYIEKRKTLYDSLTNSYSNYYSNDNINSIRNDGANVFPQDNNSTDPILINTEDEYLIEINSKEQLENDIKLISLPRKIFKSLFSLPQLIIGLILMIVGLAFGLLVYYLLAYYIPNVVSKLKSYGMLTYSFNAEYIFYIYFSVVNPIIEEWFWRMFLLNTFGTSKINRLIITACYSFYHFVVLTVFYNIWLCMFLTVVVFIGGLLFLYITKYVGPLASILSHCAADIMIVFIISNMTLNWLPYLNYH